MYLFKKKITLMGWLGDVTKTEFEIKNSFLPSVMMHFVIFDAVKNRDAKSGRCGRYICAIFFSWC